MKYTTGVILIRSFEYRQTLHTEAKYYLQQAFEHVATTLAAVIADFPHDAVLSLDEGGRILLLLYGFCLS